MIYGLDVLDFADEFGDQFIEAVRRTQGKIIPYVGIYGKGIFQLSAQPDGRTILELAPLLGERSIDYAMQYPDEFPRLLFKYGRFSVAAVRRYQAEILALARRHGDDMVYYAGRYGDNVMALIRLGAPGIALLRVLPENRLENSEFLSQSFPRLLFTLLTTSPQTLHRYVGALGPSYSAYVTPRVVQIAFWTLFSLIVLCLAGWFYDLVKRILVG
jgi:hypothetical protein